MAQIELARRKSKADYRYFFNVVFSASFDEFVGGEYIDTIADNMQSENWTIDVTGRDHFKSTRLYAEVMYDIFTSETDIEGHYFSYNTSLSSYHLSKIKKMIEANPFFVGIKDNRDRAESKLSYTNQFATITTSPAGLMSFKRGIHADRIYIDDPLRDPENKLEPRVINKINTTIKTEIFPMVNKGGICRIVGTPQTNEDFFFDDDLAIRFRVRIQPSIVDDKKELVIWPEWKSYNDLIEIRSIIGEKAFNQEYLCIPAYEEHAFVQRDKLLAVVNGNLEQLPLKEYKTENSIVGGLDIGKKVHPSHLAIFEVTMRNDKPFFTQLVSKFLDGWAYTDQIELLNSYCDLFDIDTLAYDDTRGEFQGFAEQKLLHRAMKPVSLTGNKRHAMTANLDSVIGDERVEILSDQRQIRSILGMNNNLQAMVTQDGHADAFWSFTLALAHTRVKQYRVRSI